MGEEGEKTPSRSAPFYDKSRRQKEKKSWMLRTTWESFKTWEKIFSKFRNSCGTQRMVDVCASLFILEVGIGE